ncbi:MAG: substrate-binding domain-containing protein, partial [Gaiellaceae bacterium]
MSRFLSFRVAAAAACTITLLAAGCGGGGGSGTGTSGGVLVGAGSTFVFPLVAKWIPDYSKKHGVTITYGPIGSGGGIEQVTNRTVDFGASDAPLSPDQQTACKGCLQIPWALGGTSIPYNVPGAPQ